ncbi:apolipoprotein N-acyltransferase [Microbacterium sp. cx-59]|uniref:apolipoprotein N-acyltransferase n=1 Tax=Microbacterium sp. cx-59 TaxID=2891207 RepID=UPI001E59066F|nr:apolipoprotein N-acyltransferase [Microbacterium sp. cx-59]MCC4907425.1 apolipoprotein N-acyltransferase [Microbacterium sp. cx-59]
MTRERPLLPLWAAAPTAVGAGLLLTLAFPAVSWWPVVFVAIPLALLPLIGRRAWAALLIGTLFGAAFFLVNVSFTARYLGPIPWLALSLLEAALTGVGAVLITWAYRWVPRVLRGDIARVTALPALVAGLWTLREQWLGSWPYGGFPWGRIGVTQASGPLAEVASWVGMSGLTFLIVFVCAAAVEYVRIRRLRDVRLVLPAAIVAVALVAVPAFPTTDAGSMRVGSVQGNGPAGYFDRRSAGDILASQLSATAPIVDEQMDVLVWPEGGIDSDPTNNAATAATLDALAERVDAPLIVNAATARGDEYFNTSMLWQAGDGAVQTYDKIHPVPFGEYVPDRPFFEALAPDLIGLIQREYTPGTSEPVFDLGDAMVGLAICFDVIYDDVIWAAMNGGAEVFMFQTNNADFRGTDENLQQLAFARMRAIETGRSVVNISTVGTSQVMAPDGSVIEGLSADEAGAMLTDVPLRTGLTPAVILGPWVHGVLAGGSALGLILAGVIRRRARETAPSL